MKKLILLLLILINFQYISSQNSLEYFIKNINLNNDFSLFGTSFYGDDFVIYASPKINKNTDRRRRSSSKKNKGLGFYFGISDENGNITNSKALSKEINSEHDELDLVFTNDLRTVYFTRSISSKNSKKNSSKKKKAHLELYKANVLTPGLWTNIIKLPFNIKGFSVGHPSLSKDNKTLYFASNMNGTLGALDIFKVEILGGNKYGNPINLGSKINTSETETTPFISDDTLYFSSDGRNGFGDLDVFSIKLDDNSDAKNLGEQFNSDKNDFAFTKKKNANFGYFTSNRRNAKVRNRKRNKSNINNDIFYFKILNPKEDLIKNEKENEPIFEDNKEVIINDISSFYKNSNKTIVKTETKKDIDEKLSQRRKVTLDLPSNSVKTGNPKIENIVNTDLEENKQVTLSNQIDSKKIEAIGEVTILNDKVSLNDEVTTSVNDEVTINDEFTNNEVITNEIVNSNVELINNEVITNEVITNEVITNEVITNEVITNEIANSNVELINDKFTTNNEVIANSNVELIKKQEDNTNTQVENFKNLSPDNEIAITNKKEDNSINNFRNLNSKTIEIKKESTENIAAQITNFRNLSSKLEEEKEEKRNFLSEYDICQEQLDLINNIYFDLNKHSIRGDAAIELNKVVNILKRCPNINVVIASHTDSRSSDKYNQELSQRRANSSVRYLIKKGEFLPSRFKAIGYGEAILKNRCADDIRCTRAEHQVNRRTEIEITNY